MFSSIKNFLGLDIKEQKYSLSDDPMFGRISDAKKPDKWIFSTCGYCGVGCGLYIGVKEGKAVYTKGNAAHSVNMGTLCPKGIIEHELITSSNRIPSPLIRRNGKLEKSSWDEAFVKVSESFKSITEQYGAKAIGVLSTGQLLTEEFYTLGKLVQLGLRTNNYDGNTTLCMASAVMGYKQSLGSDGPTGAYEDFEHADVIVLVGANIADNHPILKLHIAKNTKKPKIIVIDPRRSKTAQMADIFVPLKPRTDLALFNGLAYIVLEQGWENQEYLKANCTGLGDLRKHLQNYPPQEVADITGINVKILYELARLIAGSPAALTAWTMGVNQSYLGTDTVSAIINLHLLTGQIGRPGAAPFSITGQCNAMGTRESGFTSSLPGYRNFGDVQAAEKYARIVNVPPEIIPTSRGYKYGEIIEAIERGEIKALWVIATNPLVSFVDQTRLRKALAKLDLLVVQDAFMSDTAKLADVVFAAATWGKKRGPTPIQNAAATARTKRLPLRGLQRATLIFFWSSAATSRGFENFFILSGKPRPMRLKSGNGSAGGNCATIRGSPMRCWNLTEAFSGHAISSFRSDHRACTPLKLVFALPTAKPNFCRSNGYRSKNR